MRGKTVTVWIFVLVLVALPTWTMAQNKVGTTAAPFLTIGIGSRPQAMGGAFTAVADDAHSLFWNPAGLAKMDQAELLLVHSTWLADMSFEYVGAALPLGQAGTVGISATMLNVGEMEVTTVDDQEGTGLYFNSYSLAAAAHYGYQFYDRFSLGGTVKYIREQIWNESAQGFAFDIGTLFVMPFYDTRLGMSISNFGTKMQMEGRDLLALHDPDETKAGNNEKVPAMLETEQWKLPLTLRLGFSGELVRTAPHRLTWAMDWVVPNDNTEHFNVGGEYAFRESYFLRGGYRALRPLQEDAKNGLIVVDSGEGWTLGGGAKLRLGGSILFMIDYTYESYERLGGVHKYSLAFGF